jgi:hypothetical protein
MGVMNSARVNETTTGTTAALQAEIAQLRAKIEQMNKRSSATSRQSIQSTSPTALLDSRRRLSANRSIFPTSPVTTSDKKNIMSSLAGHRQSLSPSDSPYMLPPQALPLSPLQQSHMNRISSERVSVETANTCDSSKSGLSNGKENAGPTRVLLTPPATQVKVSRLIEDNTLLLRINRELEDALEEREGVIEIKEKELAALTDELEGAKYELEVALETSNGRFSHTKILLGTLHELKAENETLGMEVETLRYAKNSLTEIVESEKTFRLEMLKQLEAAQEQCRDLQDQLDKHEEGDDGSTGTCKRQRSSQSGRKSSISSTERDSEELIHQLRAMEEQCCEQTDVIATLQQDLAQANNRVFDLEAQLRHAKEYCRDRTSEEEQDTDAYIQQLKEELTEAYNKAYGLEGQLSLMTHKYMDELNRADNLQMSLGALKINLKRSESNMSLNHKESYASASTLDSGTVFACLSEGDRVLSPRITSYRHGSVIITRSTISSSPLSEELNSHVSDTVDKDKGVLRFSKGGEDCSDATVERDIDSDCSSDTDIQSFGSADTFDTEVQSNHSSGTLKTSETVVREDDASETVVKDEERWSATIVKGTSPNRSPITSYLRPSRNVMMKATSTASSLTWHDGQARPSLDDPEENDVAEKNVADEEEGPKAKKQKKTTFLKKVRAQYIM